MGVLESKVLYFFVIFFSVLLAYLSSLIKKHGNIFVVFSALLLGFVIGSRANSVGIDTRAYSSVFEALSTSYVTGLYGIDEPGFLIVSFLTTHLFNNSQAPFYFWAILTNYLILYRFHELKNHISIPIALFSYCSIFFFAQFNIMRELIAISIIFFGTRWIENRNHIKFSLCCLLSVTIHFSSIVALVLIPLSMINNWKLYSKLKRLGVVAILIVSVVLFLLLCQKYILEYGHYLDRTAKGFGYLMPLKIAITLFYIVFGPHVKGCVKKNVNSLKWNCFQNTITWTYLFGILANLISYFVLYADRAGAYFYVMESIFYGVWYKRLPKKHPLRLIIILLLIMTFVLDLLSDAPGGHGQFPYVPFWK